MSDPAVRFEGVTKRYALPSEPRSLVGRLARGARPPRTVAALDGVSFDVPSGRLAAVVGPNGSGKSTLLSLAAGLTRPTEGRVEVRGRVAAVIGVAAGFHPELTGGENAYLNAVLHGLAPAAARRLLDAILDFADLPEGFVDAPVRTYSAGMVARVGFAVAVHLEADVLLVDEALAVGDAAFRRRALDRIAEIRRAGATILCATHDEALAAEAEAILRLDRGRLAA